MYLEQVSHSASATLHRLPDSKLCSFAWSRTSNIKYSEEEVVVLSYVKKSMDGLPLEQHRPPDTRPCRVAAVAAAHSVRVRCDSLKPPCCWCSQGLARLSPALIRHLHIQLLLLDDPDTKCPWQPSGARALLVSQCLALVMGWVVIWAHHWYLTASIKLYCQTPSPLWPRALILDVVRDMWNWNCAQAVVLPCLKEKKCKLLCLVQSLFK